MHLEKPNDSRYPFIRDIPPDMRVIAFGNYGGANRDSYFAFFAPIDARLRPGMNIDGIRYAEGTLTEEQFQYAKMRLLRLLETETVAIRSKSGKAQANPG